MTEDSFEISLLKPASRQFHSLDEPVRRQVAGKLQWLADNATQIRHRSLTGDLKGLKKLRVGDYRIIYQLLEDKRLVVVHLIGHRSSIYR